MFILLYWLYKHSSTDGYTVYTPPLSFVCFLSVASSPTIFCTHSADRGDLCYCYCSCIFLLQIAGRTTLGTAGSSDICLSISFIFSCVALSMVRSLRLFPSKRSNVQRLFNVSQNQLQSTLINSLPLHETNQRPRDGVSSAPESTPGIKDEPSC